MAGVATHSVDAVTILAALYVLKVGMAVLTLKRSVTGRMASSDSEARQRLCTPGEKASRESRSVGLRDAVELRGAALTVARAKAANANTAAIVAAVRTRKSELLRS